MPLPVQTIKRIAIFRALQLGDLLCAIPAIRALRQYFPHAHITLISLPWAKALVERFPGYFDAFMHFPGYPGLPEQPVDVIAFAKFLNNVQQAEFDLAFQLQGNGTLVNPMVELFGATYTAGYCIPNDYCPNRELFLEYPTGIHEIERHLRLMRHIGITANNTQLEFTLTPDDEQELSSLQLPVSSKKYVCVHPGSRGAWRQWPTAHFAALADYCVEQGLQAVITGTASEMPIVDEVIRQMKNTPVVAAGKTSLGSMGVLIRDAFAIISNCTGVSHIASALRTPGIIISMDGEPERWAPLDTQLFWTIDWIKTPDFHLVHHSVARFN